MQKSPLIILCLLIQALLPLPACMTQGDTKPVILIYSPKAPNYGLELKRLIDEDPRVDAEVQVLQSPEIFRLKMYFPSVKMAIVTLSTSINEQLGPTLEWFFSQGGGLVGLGFASMRVATGNASEKVFPAFGSSYVRGFYDRANRKYVVAHLKGEDDEISEGIGDFDITDHKVILSYNSSANSYLPRYPEEGDLKVLFRDTTYGAPTIMKYDNVGVSVTFACFGGEDLDLAPNYYGHFTQTSEFRSLFRNAVAWVWDHERKYTESVQQASRYFDEQNEELQTALQEGRDLGRKAANWRTMRTIVILTIAIIGAVATYRLTFTKASEVEQTSAED